MADPRKTQKTHRLFWKPKKAKIKKKKKKKKKKNNIKKKFKKKVVVLKHEFVSAELLHLCIFEETA